MAGFFTKGTALWRCTTAGGAYVKIPHLVNINTPEIAADEHEVTDHDSSGGYKEFIQGLKDGGIVTFEFNFHPADSTHIQLFTDMTAGTGLFWRIILASSPVLTSQFPGFVKSFSLPQPIGVAKLTGSIRVSGEPTLT